MKDNIKQDHGLLYLGVCDQLTYMHEVYCIACGWLCKFESHPNRVMVYYKSDPE